MVQTAFSAMVGRGGIGAAVRVDVGHRTRRAARSVGSTWWQDLKEIVFPMAVPVALPSWIGLTLGVMKDTSLVL